MSDNAAPILSRAGGFELAKRTIRDALTSPNDFMCDQALISLDAVDRHDLAQREEIQRLTEERDAAQQIVNVVIGASVLTRDLVWCGGCKRGLSRTGNWYHCPQCGGKIDQESYRQACIEAEYNGGDIARYVSGDGADRIKAVESELRMNESSRESLIGVCDFRAKENAALRAELEAVKRHNGRISQSNWKIVEYIDRNKGWMVDGRTVRALAVAGISIDAAISQTAQPEEKREA